MKYSSKILKKSVYYNARPLFLYFQMQLITIHSTVSAKTAIKNLLNKEQMLAKQERFEY